MERLNSNWVSLRGGCVQLWTEGWNSPHATIARDAVHAVIQGDSVIVQHRDGRTTEFRITPSRTNAYPLRTIR